MRTFTQEEFLNQCAGGDQDLVDYLEDALRETVPVKSYLAQRVAELPQDISELFYVDGVSDNYIVFYHHNEGGPPPDDFLSFFGLMGSSDKSVCHFIVSPVVGAYVFSSQRKD